ncbi:hypothetical protein HGRIS_003089 [Hohenbuehelia grisea]|uniref:Uncharacterized protein n=1 Tax=Hohenbuehelia grisea TaxID=104357 RepID=A0ABR3JME5_9AGAR
MRLNFSFLLISTTFLGLTAAMESAEALEQAILIAQSPYASAVQPDVKFVGSADKLKADEKAATSELIRAVLQAAEADLKLAPSKMPVEVSEGVYMGKGKDKDAHIVFKFTQGAICKPCTGRVSARGDVMPKITDAKNKVVWPNLKS